MDGAPASGAWNIVDSFNAPTTSTTPIDTRYGGGATTGMPAPFAGGATPVAAMYGASPSPIA
eukprot:CAMPEP_0184326484 /NCGR_PEP_ID=MMETSP1049-20130417/142591_1 /TAXON_ID=77928 /ORGANISM="Proteomonas sulcata, Strain CCMP704" /LENGTH=61 /DNA_ID=CAMNT_0026648687 /DNA_START=500 /DNA_END=685 /DNA_ORIENTATION=+